MYEHKKNIIALTTDSRHRTLPSLLKKEKTEVFIL